MQIMNAMNAHRGYDISSILASWILCVLEDELNVSSIMTLPDIRASLKTDLSRQVGIRLTECKVGFTKRFHLSKEIQRRAGSASALGVSYASRPIKRHD